MPPAKRKGTEIKDTNIPAKMSIPRPRCAAPSWSAEALLPDGSFGKVSSDDFSGQYYVLFFYPADFTFVCPTEIIEFSEKAVEFEKHGCKVIGCSVDTVFCHLKWTATPRKEGGIGSMNIPILGDATHKVCESFGVLNPEDGLALRGTFIVDGKGIIRYSGVNDFPVGRNVDEVVRLVAACQFTDVHGEVCPASWTPGSKTMKADPKGSLEYFNAVNQ